MSSHTEQVEKAYQKQPNIFEGTVKRGVSTKKSKGKKSTRYYKNIGLGFKTPKSAVEGVYIDKKCPWTGQVSIRGRLIKGYVKTNKMKRSVIVRRDYLHYIKKYNRFEKRHTNIPAHLSPAFRINEGDDVVIGQCRPLSKTIRYNVLKIERKADSAGKSFDKF
jgi:small subunit ribosomal protein S11e